MASLTKPEVHNVLHCHQKKTEPRPQVTRAENFEKYGRVVYEKCQHTDRQTYTPMAIFRTAPEIRRGKKRNKKKKKKK